MKRGFTLIEMMVAIGIIAVLVAAMVGSYSSFTHTAEKAKCRELVFQVATALTTLYEREGNWPKILAVQGKTDGKLDADTAIALKNYYSLSVGSNGKLAGYDRFGIISPWALDVVKRGGNSVSLDTRVSTSKKGGAQTIDDHILHFALDLDGDGIIEGAMIGGEAVDVRATAIVWCAGRGGFMEPYSKGLKGDGVYSWSSGQTKKVK